MENVCHTLAGLALARACRAERVPLATTALVAGANLPDVDLAWSSFQSALVYFHWHRGATHSIAGFVGLSLVWWLALLGASRWLRVAAGRTAPFALLGAAAAGIASHLVMDAANSYGVRPFLPWSGPWVYGDLWVVVDPWLWLLLGGAVYFSGAFGRRRAMVWLMGAAAAAIVVLAAANVPAVARGAWAAGLAVVLAGGWRAGSLPAGAGVRLARAGVGLVLAYALLCALLHAAALGRVRRLAADHPEWSVQEIAALPRPADPLHWEGMLVSRASVRYGTVGALPSRPADGAAFTTLQRGLDLEATGSLMATCAGEVIAEFFRFPCAAIEEGPAIGGRFLVVRDARYTRKGRGFAVYTAPLDASGRPVVEKRDCP